MPKIEMQMNVNILPERFSSVKVKVYVCKYMYDMTGFIATVNISSLSQHFKAFTLR